MGHTIRIIPAQFVKPLVTAVQQIEAASSAIYVLPTGGGKAVVFRKLIEALAARCRKSCNRTSSSPAYLRAKVQARERFL
jgi:hypothetical protein